MLMTQKIQKHLPNTQLNYQRGGHLARGLKCRVSATTKQHPPFVWAEQQLQPTPQQAQGRVVPRCACGVGEGFGAALGEITCCWDQLGPLLLRMAQRGELQGGHTQQGNTLGLR